MQGSKYLSSIVLTKDMRKNKATMIQNFGFLKAVIVFGCDSSVGLLLPSWAYNWNKKRFAADDIVKNDVWTY